MKEWNLHLLLEYGFLQLALAPVSDEVCEFRRDQPDYL